MPAPHHSVFTGRMPFLLPNQQRQGTEGFFYQSSENKNNKPGQLSLLPHAGQEMSTGQSVVML